MKKKLSCLFLLCMVILISCFWNMLFLQPIKLTEDEIKEINIGIELNIPQKSYSGNALISKKDELVKVIDTLNDIKVIKSDYSLDDLEGDSPTAWIQIYRNDGEVDTINIYTDILVYKEKFYAISFMEYNALIRVCEKY